jgi:hypothetical protein
MLDGVVDIWQTGGTGAGAACKYGGTVKWATIDTTLATVSKYIFALEQSLGEKRRIGQVPESMKQLHVGLNKDEHTAASSADVDIIRHFVTPRSLQYPLQTLQ